MADTAVEVPQIVGFQERLILLSKRFTRYMLSEFRDEQERGPLTIGQLQVLREMSNGPMTMTQVAQTAGVTKASATSMVERLHMRGLLERFQEPGDRRTIWVKLTPEGDQLQRSVHERALRLVERLMSQLSGDELKRLEDSLSLLDRAIEEVSSWTSETEKQRHGCNEARLDYIG